MFTILAQARIRVSQLSVTIFFTLLLSGIAALGSNVTVPGTANPWLAGATNGTTAAGGDVAPDESPVAFTNFTGGTALQFSATGSAGYAPGAESGPEGVPGYFIHDPAQNGIGAINNALANELLGVFLDDAVPALDGTTPDPFDFGPGGLQDYQLLAPALNQPFAIGNGAQRAILAPAKATRLFLGICDGSGWYNNTGAFSVDVNVLNTPVLLQFAPTGNREYQLAWSAPLTGSYRVLASTNLVGWSEYIPPTSHPIGLNTNIVGSIPGSPQGYFRIQYLP